MNRLADRRNVFELQITAPRTIPTMRVWSTVDEWLRRRTPLVTEAAVMDGGKLVVVVQYERRRNVQKHVLADGIERLIHRALHNHLIQWTIVVTSLLNPAAVEAAVARLQAGTSVDQLVIPPVGRATKPRNARARERYWMPTRTFGNETLIHIAPDLMRRCAVSGNAGVIIFFVHLHFDPAAEAANETVRHQSRKSVEVFDADMLDWSARPQAVVVRQCLRRCANLLSAWAQQDAPQQNAADPRYADCAQARALLASDAYTRDKTQMLSSMRCVIENRRKQRLNPDQHWTTLFALGYTLSDV
jgi:hypothetical protein